MAMTHDEVLLILTRCASFDRRTIGRTDVEAWHLVIGGLTYAECDAAVLAWYKENREWIMPSDVRAHVFEERDQWLRDHPGYGPLNPHIVPPWDTRKELDAGGSGS